MHQITEAKSVGQQLSSFDVQLKEQHLASANTATFSTNNHQKKNSANYFNSANSEKQDRLKNKQYQQRLINSIDLSGLTSEQTDRVFAKTFMDMICFYTPRDYVNTSTV